MGEWVGREEVGGRACFCRRGDMFLFRGMFLLKVHLFAGDALVRRGCSRFLGVHLFLGRGGKEGCICSLEGAFVCWVGAFVCWGCKCLFMCFLGAHLFVHVFVGSVIFLVLGGRGERRGGRGEGGMCFCVGEGEGEGGACVFVFGVLLFCVGEEEGVVESMLVFVFVFVTERGMGVEGVHVLC